MYIYLSSQYLASMDVAKQMASWDEKHWSLGICRALQWMFDVYPVFGVSKWLGRGYLSQRMFNRLHSWYATSALFCWITKWKCHVGKISVYPEAPRRKYLACRSQEQHSCGSVDDKSNSYWQITLGMQRNIALRGLLVEMICYTKRLSTHSQIYVHILSHILEKEHCIPGFFLYGSTAASQAWHPGNLTWAFLSNARPCSCVMYSQIYFTSSYFLLFTQVNKPGLRMLCNGDFVHSTA